MGVGEMGSVWVTDESLVHAACALLSRHLFIFLDSKKVVGGLHDAYAALKLADHQYGSFYTGPSATARYRSCAYYRCAGAACSYGYGV